MAKHNSNRQARGKRHQAGPARQRWLWVGAALLGLVVVAAAVNYWPRVGAPPQLSAARLASDPTLGPAGAPITLVEYGDFG
jgi:uncharacterized membrane protein